MNKMNKLIKIKSVIEEIIIVRISKQEIYL